MRVQTNCMECGSLVTISTTQHDRELAVKALRDASNDSRLGPLAIEILRARANAILASATPGQQARHVCGAAGYGHPDDVCPACEAEEKSRATPATSEENNGK